MGVALALGGALPLATAGTQPAFRHRRMDTAIGAKPRSDALTLRVARLGESVREAGPILL